jgi:hypothetical protein
MAWQIYESHTSRGYMQDAEASAVPRRSGSSAVSARAHLVETLIKLVHRRVERALGRAGRMARGASDVARRRAQGVERALRRRVDAVRGCAGRAAHRRRGLAPGLLRGGAGAGSAAKRLTAGT